MRRSSHNTDCLGEISSGIQRNVMSECIHDDDPSIKLHYVEKGSGLYLRCPSCGEEFFLRPLTSVELSKLKEVSKGGVL